MNGKSAATLWLLTVTLSVAPAAPARSLVQEAASWEEQLHEMGYLLIYASSINVINGLNLTTEQAEGLGDLARQMEKVCQPPTDFSKKVPPDVEQVRRTYLDLIETLKDGRPASDALRERVYRAREIESRLIRKSLQYRPLSSSDLSCVACHAPLTNAADRQERSEDLRCLGQHKQHVDRAHVVMIYGKRGAQELARLGREVDGILNKSQKAIFDDFSCCLIPPEDLSDPVRIGQAEAPRNLVDMLERVRSVPDDYWPTARRRLLERFVEIEHVKRPDLTEDDANRLRRRLEDVMTTARELSDVDFELRKYDLCKQINPQVLPAASPIVRSYKFAYFLLLPGTVELYDRLVKGNSDD